jgi:plastocyanin
LAQWIALAMLGASPSIAFGQSNGSAITGEIAARSPKARAGVVVHLDKVPGTFRPPAKPAQLDQKGMTFIPHILAVQKGTTVVFANHDSVSHNVFTPDGEKYNLGSWGQGQSKTHTFGATGVYHQLCNVHPEMGAVIVVLENPYFAVSGADGKFQIEGVPPGTYTLKTWSEKGAETSRQVIVTAGAPTNIHIELGK